MSQSAAATMWDGRFRLPVPPVDAVSNVHVDMVATAIYLGLSALVLVFGLNHWRRTGSPIIVLLMVGGALCSAVEPFVNIVGAVWHPIVNQITAFNIMGRPMPWFIVAGYIFYFGALGSATFLAFQKGVTTRQYWIWCCVPMVVDIVMEELMLHWNLYYYYGEQPLILIAKLPLWWVPGNSVGQILAVAFIALVKPVQRGWKLLLIPLLVPIWDAVAYAAISLPSWIVVNTPVPTWLNQMGGLATCLLAFGVLYALAQILPVDSTYARLLAKHRAMNEKP